MKKRIQKWLGIYAIRLRLNAIEHQIDDIEDDVIKLWNKDIDREFSIGDQTNKGVVVGYVSKTYPHTYAVTNEDGYTNTIEGTYLTMQDNDTKL